MSNEYQAEFVRLIKRLSNLMNQRIDDVLKAHGMARSQFQVLYVINKSGSLTQKQLLETLNVEPATLSGLIDTLETKRLVKRSIAASDKRSKKLALTRSGQKIVDGIPHPGRLIEKSMLKGVSDPDRKVFEKVCTKLIDNLQSEILTK
jgi:DNA-binding MarR family transcriptional regulator